MINVMDKIHNLDLEKILKAIRPQRWFAEKACSYDDFRLKDWALIGASYPQAFYWILLDKKHSRQTYSIVVKETGDGFEDASYAPEFIQELLSSAPQGIATKNGGRIALTGHFSDHKTKDIKPLEPGKSSNSLQIWTTNKAAFVIKSYRLLSDVNFNEVKVLSALSSGGTTADVFGALHYFSFNQDEPYCIGLITQYLCEPPAYRLYSKAIKHLFSQLEGGILPTSHIKQQVDKLNPLSRNIGQQLQEFHRQLNSEFQSPHKKKFGLTPYLNCNIERWKRVQGYVRRDDNLSETARERITQQLSLAYEKYLTPCQTVLALDIPASVAHGDLHLAHIFIDELHTHKCKIIDPSPRCLDSRKLEFTTQSMLQDLQNLRRGFEYFSFDEILDAISIRLKRPQLETAALLIEQPDELITVCPDLCFLLEYWSDHVFSEVYKAYKTATAIRSTTNHMPPPVVERSFYFCRFLKELEYNYSYDRQYFKYCDFYYLNKLIGF